MGENITSLVEVIKLQIERGGQEEKRREEKRGGCITLTDLQGLPSHLQETDFTEFPPPIRRPFILV